MKAARLAPMATLLAVLTSSPAHIGAQPESVPQGESSAAAIFEQVLETQGLDAARARLCEIIADTTGAYEIDPFELLRALPMRLRQTRRRTESLALIETLEPLFGGSPRYWPERANAHLQAGDLESARTALSKAAIMDSTRTDIAWMLENLDGLLVTIRAEIAAEGKYAAGQNTGLQGPYLGQTPPGSRPEVFAPGIVNTTENEYSITFTPDGREIYFSRSGVGTMVCRWTAEGWTAPQPIHLIDERHLTEEASVAPDGKRIFFCGRADAHAERAIHVAQRSGSGWGPPTKLFIGMYPTVASNGVLYYTEITQRPDYGIIVRRPPAGDGFAEPEALPAGINSGAPDAHPYIAPDESFMVFDTYRQPGEGLYVVFRQADGSWGEIVPLCDRLGIPPVGQGALTPDGKYLFFSLCGDMYWVDAAFLAELSGKR